MPLLINPDTNERVRATHAGAEVLREQGYTDADPHESVGGAVGIPAAEHTIVDNLRADDWNAADPDRIARFLASGDRAYAEAALAYEREHQNRAEVIELAGAHLEQLDAVADEDGPQRPAKSASRQDWDAYAASLGIDPSEHQSKDDLIEAVDAEQD